MFCLENSLQANYQCILCLRRNGVDTLGNASSVKKIKNSMRSRNKPSMPSSDKPTFLRPHMLARGREMNINANETETLQIEKERNSNGQSDLKRYSITKSKRFLQQALDHMPSGLQKEEWHWLIAEIYLKDPHKKASAQNSTNRANYKKERLHRTGSCSKVFKLKSRDSAVGYGGGVKAKDIRGPSHTRVELEVELNATRKKKMKFLLIE
ncbi:hypothetical protein Cgig2_015402 [Carnegiea gigantea]|uniref:Uncharacterized protein n=1 Tax=Carnegiea gigantea TaxID=171969 RepID=A0A9Q1Q7C6_9CARY|nr:hypothetical protein Cgig2_015402 [Carnegiea gigantea]